MSEKKVLEKMLEIFQDEQMIVAIEELSELQKELTKALRGQLKKENLSEEIADVYIMLEQIIMYYDLDKEQIDSIMANKIKRTKEKYLYDYNKIRG